MTLLKLIWESSILRQFRGLGMTNKGKRLQNRVALITGAGSGIAKEIALGYASEGGSFALVPRTISELEETAMNRSKGELC